MERVIVVDKVLLSASSNNIEDCIDLAAKHGLGIEVMDFAFPNVLDGHWEHELATYRTILRIVPGPITIHGPFMDMVSGSPDALINHVCIQRYQQSIHIAAELGAKIVNLHANFIGSLHNAVYREGWHKRNVPFWKSLAEHAKDRNVIITLENMWEFEPSIIADVLSEVDHPNLKACLDIGHAMLFGDSGYKIEDWLAKLEPWLIHTHMNNNNGIIDEHHGFDWEHGVLQYKEILDQIRSLKNPPNIVLEMHSVDDMRNSLHYLELEKPEEKEKPEKKLEKTDEKKEEPKPAPTTPVSS
jgi:sugar phosphate isomerase/epimerase